MGRVSRMDFMSRKTCSTCQSSLYLSATCSAVNLVFLLSTQFLSQRAAHSPIRHDARPVDIEAILDPLHHRNKRRHIRRVPRPHFATHRSAMIVQNNSYYHLIQVGTMIFGMAQFSDGLASLSLKVDGGGVEKDTIHPGKKIPALMKQIFLNEILCATRGKGCAILLILKLFSQKGHRPVKMMQSQPIAASDRRNGRNR